MESNDRFQVLEKLGAGGMGVVYRVFDAKQGSEVALKRALQPSADSLYRLKREFRARAGLAHPNLVHLYELIAEGEYLAFTMELVNGQTFLRYVRQNGESAVSSTNEVTSHGVGAGRTVGIDEGETVALSGMEPAAGGSSDPEMATRVLGENTVPDKAGSNPTAAADAATVPARLPVESSADTAEPVDASAVAPFDSGHELRTREALAGLLRGINALHESSQVHRDIKSSNVLIEPDGRVVILDFGLTGDLARDDAQSAAFDLAGTPTYMAPELVSGKASIATDMYAVGVLLFEAMVNRPPFEGPLLQSLQAKATREAPDPRTLNPQLPDDLAELACDLLRRDPDQRPSAKQALDRVNPRSDRAGSGQAATAMPFEGRLDEIEQLDAMRRNLGSALGPSVCRVVGDSGLGKTRLLQEFLRRSGSEVLVFSSVCNPNESIPFQGVDAIVERLARYLAGLSAAERRSVLPRRLFALKRLFATLNQVPEINAAEAPEKLQGPSVDATELRQLAFGALRELLGRIAATKPTVLWVDDWQWCDPDSLSLLQEALSAEDAPELMMAASYREEDRESSPSITTWENFRPYRGEHDELSLQALAHEETRRLISQLAPAASGELVAAAVERARGNPFMAVELGRYIAAQGDSDEALPDDVIARLIERRLAWLDADARTLVETVALANGPLAPEVALEAAGVQQSPLMIRRLCDGHLLRETSAEKPGLVTYHDSLRETVVAGMDAEALASTHLRLAQALQKATPDSLEGLFVHWAGAGETARAIEVGLEAAERASDSLAFGLAARLYHRTLVLIAEPDRDAEILQRYATALANCGRGLEAAEHFLLAAERSTGRASLLLRRQGAEQLIKAGYASRGWRELQTVLKQLNIPVPTSQFGCLASAMVRRIGFLLRPLPKPEDRSDQHSLTPTEITELETLWIASTSLSMLNHTLSDSFRTRHMARTLKSGSRSMIARVLSYEVAMEAHIGGSFFRKHAEKLLGKVENLVLLTKDSYDEAWRQLAIVNYWFTDSNWMACVQAARQAEEIFAQECVGTAWERSTAKHFRHLAQANLGELSALGRALEEGLARAEANADVSDALNHLCPEPVLAWIGKGRGEWALDKIESLHAQLEPPAAEWPDNIYRASDAHRMMAKVLIAYSQGRVEEGYRLMQSQWKPLKDSFILGLQQGRMCYPSMRALGALGLLAGPDRDGLKRSALTKEVERTRRDLAKDPRPMAIGLATLLEAGQATIAGHREQAISCLKRAQSIFDDQYLGVLSHAARRGLVALGGGDERALLDEIAEWTEEQEVSEGDALFRVYLPFLDV